MERAVVKKKKAGTAAAARVSARALLLNQSKAATSQAANASGKSPPRNAESKLIADLRKVLAKEVKDRIQLEARLKAEKDG